MLENVYHFFAVKIWEVPKEPGSRLELFGLKSLRAISYLFYRFWVDHCLMRASALAYMTILALVPLFGLMFSILKGLGVQRRLEPYILSKITIISPEAINRLVEYIDKVNVKSLGVMGTVWLLIIAITVFRNIEGALNQIWRVSKGRSLQRQISNYLSLALILPISIFLVFSINTAMESNFIVKHFLHVALFLKAYHTLLKLSPFVVLWVVLTFIYFLMPNTRVRLSSALLGGVIGGTLWQLAQLAYLRFRIGASHYNAIYGAVYHIPLLLVWIYVSWAIILFGAEIAHLFENRRSCLYRIDIGEPPPMIKKLWALTLLEIIGKRFLEGREPLKTRELAGFTGLGIEKVKSLLKEMATLHIVEYGEETGGVVLPTVALEKVQIGTFLEALEKSAPGKGLGGVLPKIGSGLAQDVLEKFYRGGVEELNEMTWEDFVRRSGNNMLASLHSCS